MKLIIVWGVITFFQQSVAQYDANWESLNSRTLPEWYDQAKIGIFLHWGVYSVPSFGSEWFWYRWKEDKLWEYIDFMEKNYSPRFIYQDFADDFKAELYDPAEWAELFRRSGAKYVVLTSKHYEGFTLWPSDHSYNWNSRDAGPHRDLLGDLATAIRTEGLRFGAYYSLREWFNPLYHEDEKNQFRTTYFIKSKVLPELTELVTVYKPDILWSDGATTAPSSYWNATQFVAWLYNDSPVKDIVVTNDRWGDTTICIHGGFYTCYNAHLVGKKWERSIKLDLESWGYRRNARSEDILSLREIIGETVRTVSRGGNILINIGPTKDGTIAPIFQERLLGLGTWLSTNGEAIYDSRTRSPWNDVLNSNVCYTSKDDVIYAIVLEWPWSNQLSLGSVSSLVGDPDVYTVRMLGYDQPLTWSRQENTVLINFPEMRLVTSEWAWVLKFPTEL